MCVLASLLCFGLSVVVCDSRGDGSYPADKQRRRQLWFIVRVGEVDKRWSFPWAGSANNINLTSERTSERTSKDNEQILKFSGE
uniref:Putative secreted protein n=1 Tax=Anopheles triannulatus TaxID=58253 RepID=A0A2M4B3Z4_9DIPT